MLNDVLLPIRDQSTSIDFEFSTNDDIDYDEAYAKLLLHSTANNFMFKEATIK
jgi:hypothetical protein